MTVCIAAICSWDSNAHTIVGASDRMLSASDVKFEPPQMKLFQFSDHVVALVAGDPYAQIAICNKAVRAMKVRESRGKAVTSVHETAELYSEAFTAVRREKAETLYLKPLGLDAHEFIVQQREMQGDLVSRLVHDLTNCPLDSETIIAGMDKDGPHIYVVRDPGTLDCANAIGFAAIGSGKAHAEAQFMQAKHTKDALFDATLLQTYIAKKRAEGAPTVGSFSDLFFFRPEGFSTFKEEIHEHLQMTYLALERKIEAASFEAVAETATFLKAIREGSQVTPKTELPLSTKSAARQRTTRRVKPT